MPTNQWRGAEGAERTGVACGSHQIDRRARTRARFGFQIHNWFHLYETNEEKCRREKAKGHNLGRRRTVGLSAGENGY